MNHLQQIPPHTRLVWGRLLAILGILLGMALNTLSVLGNLEANAYWGGEEGSSYVHINPVDASIASLRCPLIMTSRNDQRVTVAINNQTQDSITSPVQAYFSDLGYLQERGDLKRIPIGPGQTQNVAWTVAPADAASTQLIMVRIFLYDFYPVPSRTATCGILFVPTTLISGTVVAILLIGGILISLVAGLVLWRSSMLALRDQKLWTANGVVILATLIVITLLANLLSFWLIAAFLFLISFLLALILLSSIIQQSI